MVAAVMQASLGLSRLAFRQTQSSRSLLSARLPHRSLVVQATGNRFNQSNTGRNANAAADDAAADVSEQLRTFFEDLQTKWEENDEKPTTVALGLAGFVGLWAASGLLDSINRLPFVGTLFEVVGLGVTGWFVYRWGATAEDRKELKREVDSFFSKVGVNK